MGRLHDAFFGDITLATAIGATLRFILLDVPSGEREEDIVQRWLTYLDVVTSTPAASRARCVWEGDDRPGIREAARRDGHEIPNHSFVER